MADSAVIVLHLNSDTAYPSVRENNSDFEWIWSQPRVEVNCIRWPARRWSGQLLRSQLANVRWARCRGVRSRHVVFQASNMWWVRLGMERHVAATGSSVPRVADVGECKRLALPEGGHGNFQACTPLKGVWSDRTSQATELLLNKTGTSEDRKSPVDPCYVPPFPGMRFIVQRKHEGSYYPTQDIYRMMDYLEEGLNNPELMAERINATMDSRCQVQGRRHTLLRPDLWSTEWPLEEVLPQSWVANFGLTNGTGDVMHKEFKWKRHLWSCGDIKPQLARPGVFAAKLHDLRDEGPTAEEHRILLATCSIPPP